MSKSLQFFHNFWTIVRRSPNWATMTETVENSPWHREANVAVHTTMTIERYLKMFSPERTERQRILTLMALLFHDFGKPEAEEEKPKEDGTVYRTYAGHEPLSGNEFMSFMCEQHVLREAFFRQGFSWTDLRAIKVMIEHHLPYGLEKPLKRIALRSTMQHTLGVDYICFYDMLISDCYGRISDDHDTKKEKVHAWIAEFDKVPVVSIDPLARRKNGLGKWKHFETKETNQPTMYMLYGVSGAGKSTYLAENEEMIDISGGVIMSEDTLRMKFAEQHLDEIDLSEWPRMTPQEQYDAAWKFCAMGPLAKEFDTLVKATWQEMLKRGEDVYLDRMNQTRKGRAPWIEAAKQHGFRIVSVEFYVSEAESNRRQKLRGEKYLWPKRVHQVYMQQETPWYGHEVDKFVVFNQKK